MQPFIYQMTHDMEQSEEEPYSSNSYNLKRKRKGAEKHKRVTLSKTDLEAAMFQLFQKKSEYTLAELGNMLNHPKASLRTALNSLCYYDHSRKVYCLQRSI